MCELGRLWSGRRRKRRQRRSFVTCARGAAIRAHVTAGQGRLNQLHHAWPAIIVFVAQRGAVAAIAQLGERQTEDLKVPGSIPGLGTYFSYRRGRPL
jgi:hypothetical protein